MSTPARWQQIEQVYHAALSLQTAERQALLAGADADLRREVESLLAQDASTSATLIAGWSRSAEIAVANSADGAAVRGQLGPYLIEAPIGSGGMGEVFRATDTRLRRTVAIKLLPRDRIASPETRRRFLQEARAASALSHPNIVVLFDIANDGGTEFLVMEHVTGQALKDMIPPEGLPMHRVVAYGSQIALALGAAHAVGMVHRDIKPANVMVTTEDQIKVLDFGIAKLPADPSENTNETMAGTVVGTVAYMSPEQTRGEKVDGRSDIFSLGCVLYQAATGKLPFTGPSTLAVMHQIATADPVPPSSHSRTLTAAFDALVARCLAKDPDNRPHSATDLADELKALTEQPQRTHTSRPQRAAAAARPSLAVLPFANMSSSADDEYFSDGLAEEIINLMAQVAGLKVIARTSAFSFKGKNEDIRKIAEALGVTTILEGSVRRAGNRIRVTAQLIQASDGSHLWSQRYDREMSDVFAIQDEISQSIATALQLKLEIKPAQHTPRLPAYEAFLRGRQSREGFTPDAHARATEYLKQAMALDPDYAAPHTELGLNYLFTAQNAGRPFREVAPLIRQEAELALELDPTGTEPHFLLGAVAAVHDYNWKEARKQIALAMAGPSVSTEVRYAYASYILNPAGLFNESLEELRRCVEQDPLNIPWRAIHLGHLSFAGRDEEALEQSRKVLEIDERFWVTHHSRGEAFLALYRTAEAIAAGEKALQAIPGHAMPLGLLAAALVRAGDHERAAALLREMGESPRPVWGRVSYHLWCSEIDEAADWFELMIEQRDPFTLIFGAVPRCRPLRESPRWPKLAAMMNLSEVMP